MKKLLLSVTLFASMLLHGYGDIPIQQAPNAQQFLVSDAALNQAKKLYYYGTLYRDGNGVACDLHKAFEFFYLAASSNYPPAQYQVGMMFRHGHGIHASYDYAKYWLKKSADNQYRLAQEIYTVYYKNPPVEPVQYVTQWNQ